jgi:hypothetical protein
LAMSWLSKLTLIILTNGLVFLKLEPEIDPLRSWRHA